jgi:hypothetical protein
MSSLKKEDSRHHAGAGNAGNAVELLRKERNMLLEKKDMIRQ